MFEPQSKMSMSLNAADRSKLKSLLKSLPEVSEVENVKELLLLLASRCVALSETRENTQETKSLQDANQLLTVANNELAERLKTAETQLQQVVADLAAAAKEVQAAKDDKAGAVAAIDFQLQTANAELGKLKSNEPFKLGENQILLTVDADVANLARRFRTQMKNDGWLKTDEPEEFFNNTARQWMKIYYGHYQ